MTRIQRKNIGALPAKALRAVAPSPKKGQTAPASPDRFESLRALARVVAASIDAIHLNRLWLRARDPQELEANGDLLLAKQIYLGGRDPQKTLTQQQGLYVKTDYEAAYIALHRDPRRWIEAARQKIEAGDILGGEALLMEAERNNTFTVFRRKELPGRGYPRLVIARTEDLRTLNDEKARDGSPNLEATKLSADRDPNIQKEIEALRGEISSFEAKIADRLKAEIAALEAKESTGDEQILKHLKHGLRMQRDLDRLEAWRTQIHSLDVAPLIRKARLDLANGFFRRDIKPWKEGLRAVAALERYAAAELKKNNECSALATLYPKGTPLVFLSDLSEASPEVAALKRASAYDMRPAAKAVEGSQINKTTLPRLEKDNPELAAHVKRMLADCRATRIAHEERGFSAETGFSYELGEEITGYREPAAVGHDVEALERRTMELKGLYGNGDLNSPAASFAREIKADEETANLKDDGFRYSQDTQGGIAYLRAVQEEKWSPAEWLNFYSTRAENYQKFLEEEVARAHKQDEEELRKRGIYGDEYGGFDGNEKIGPVHGRGGGFDGDERLGPTSSGGGGFDGDEPPPRAEQQAQARLDAFLSEFARLKADSDKPEIQKIHVQFLSMGEIKMKHEEFLELWPQFAEFSQATRAWLEAHLQGLLRWRIGEIEKISPAAKDRTRPLLQELELNSKSSSNPAPDPWSLEGRSLEGRLQSYAVLDGAIDRETLRADISHTAETYQTMKKEVDLHDGIWNGLGAFFTTIIDPIIASSPVINFIDPEMLKVKWNKFDTGGNFTVMEHKYESLLQELDDLTKIGSLPHRDDLAKISSVKQRFLQLNNLAIHQALAEQHKDASTFNMLTIGPGIIAASAATGGLCGAAVAFLGGGATLQSAVTWAMFTLASRVWRGAIDDGLNGMGEAFAKIGEDPGGLIVEFLLNWGMSAFVGKWIHGYTKAFENRLQSIVLGRLVEQGLLAEGTTVTEEVLVKNPTLRAAYLKECLLLENAFIEVGKRMGIFATEITAFQTWDFLTDPVKQGGVDPLGAVKRNFSGSALLHTMAFLGALRVGHNFATMGLETVKTFAGAYRGLSSWANENVFAVGEDPFMAGKALPGPVNFDAGQVPSNPDISGLEAGLLAILLLQLSLAGVQDPKDSKANR